VIMEDSLDPIKATISINQQFVGKRTMPLDIVVNRKNEFAQAIKGNTTQRMISDNGVMLYEAS